MDPDRIRPDNRAAAAAPVSRYHSNWACGVECAFRLWLTGVDHRDAGDVTIDDSLEVLSDDECRTLLEQETIGRVGLSVDALPAILPVNYSMVDGRIIFRTGEGAKLRAALSHTVVAFEVDHADPDREQGWSVLVVGVAEPVEAPTETSAHRAAPTPWAGGHRQHLVRIRPEMISGRRVAHPDRQPNNETPTLLRAADAARKAVTVSRSTSLRQTAAVLTADPAGAAHVHDPGTPIEVVSWRDLAAAMAAGADPDTSTAADLTLVRRPYPAGASELTPAPARVLASGTSEALVLDEDGPVGLATLASLCAPLRRRPPATDKTSPWDPLPSCPQAGRPRHQRPGSRHGDLGPPPQEHYHGQRGRATG